MDEKIEINLAEPENIPVEPTVHAEDTPKQTSPVTGFQKFKNWATTHRKIVISLASVVLITALSCVIFFTDLKYPVLGNFLTNSVEISVVDSKSQLSVPGATVELDSQKKTTDDKGYVKFDKVHIGDREVTVRKDEYEVLTNKLKVLNQSNSLVSYSLVSTVDFAYFSIKNSISDQYIENAVVNVEGLTAQTDKDGIAKVKIGKNDVGLKNVSVLKEGYEDSTSQIALGEGKVNVVRLLPQGKDYFLSNRRGKVDLYQSNLDGSQLNILLEATGQEDFGTYMSISPDNQWIVLSSTREGVRNKYGVLTPQLYLINTQSKSISRLNTNYEFSVLGWRGNNLIYTTTNDADYASQVMKIMVYNVNTRQYLETASATTIYAWLVNDYIVYSLQPYSADNEGTIYYVKVGETARVEILNQRTYYVYVTDLNTITFSTTVSDAWYTYEFETKKLTRLTGVPPLVADKEYVRSQDKSKTAYLETRDGKTDVYLNEDGKEVRLTSIGAVRSPFRWIGNEYVIFKVIREGETADYVVSLSGGTPQKISDVFSGGYGSRTD